ncbi:MAG: class I SAM-dependent methyltransferase [Betaproteobacteria bacterium]|nr:class I SAM-dependent methyltransferase [Betaproteobacteria bacterium]
MSALRLPLRHLPQPEPADLARSRALRERVLDEIERDGFLPFARFMELALYAPGLGYYASGTPKLGAAGDFVTAPETTAFFGAALAAQLAELIAAGCEDIVELGAGSGILAADILRELERRDRLPRRYGILEISAALAERQRTTLRETVPHLLDRVHWLERLPQRIRGVVLGNEVLDAMPTALVTCRNEALLELGVTRKAPASDELTWSSRPARGELLHAAQALQLPEGYTTELHLAARALVRALSDTLERGVVLLLDYGFTRREYYHPQRNRGTLMCHYRHYAHDDPLQLVGLQDISVHVDFSALADAAHESGLKVLGYATQAHLLINCNILDRLASIPVNDTVRYTKAAAGVQKLLSPAEMGELFKAIAFGRGIEPPLLGFSSGDRRATL